MVLIYRNRIVLLKTLENKTKTHLRKPVWIWKFQHSNFKWIRTKSDCKIRIFKPVSCKSSVMGWSFTITLDEYLSKTVGIYSPGYAFVVYVVKRDYPIIKRKSQPQKRKVKSSTQLCTYSFPNRPTSNHNAFYLSRFLWLGRHAHTTSLKIFNFFKILVVIIF